VRVVGVDISTKKIAAVDLQDDGSYEGWEVKGRGRLAADRCLAADRFDQLSSAFSEYLFDRRPEVVYVEGLAFVKSRKAIVGLSEILGAVRALCSEFGARCEVTPGYQWKIGVGIQGKKKEDVARWVSAQGVELGTQDLKDAYAIARYGQQKEASNALR
jgi:Holliday junction resolvasome RuvABC endonuclease subunit